MSRLRGRVPWLLGLWASVGIGEAILYYFFLSRPYFRSFAAPFAVALAVAALVATWRALRGRRDRDRRSHERRSWRRRAEE
jgi:hypothetical protein